MTFNKGAPVDDANPLPVTGGGGTAASPSITAPAPSATAAAASVASSVSTTTLLAANTARKGATIYYDGSAILYLLEGSGTPTSALFTYKLGNGFYTSYEAPAGFTGTIKGIWSSAVGSALVTERTA